MGLIYNNNNISCVIPQIGFEEYTDLITIEIESCFRETLVSRIMPDRALFETQICDMSILGHINYQNQFPTCYEDHKLNRCTESMFQYK